MKIIKCFKVRLLPDKIQEQKLKDHAGLQRFIYNSMLEYCINRYDNQLYIQRDNCYKWFSEFGKLITFCKNEVDDYKWLNQFSRHTINMIQRDLQNRYERYFKFQESNKFLLMIVQNKPTNKLQYKHHPKFKKKKNDYNISIPFDANDVYFCKINKRYHFHIPKLGKVLVQTNYKLPVGIINNSHIKNTRIKLINNKWILFFSMEIDSQDVQLNKDSVIGIDLGIKHLCAVSKFNGIPILFKNINKELKRIKRLEVRLNRLQQSISRKYEMFKKLHPNEPFQRSKSFSKDCVKLRKVYYRLSCIRKNYLDHISRWIVNQLPEIIVLEDLNLQLMIKNHRLVKYELDQSLGLFRQMIKYKAEELGIKIILADKTYPSTQLCSHCGSRYKMKLSDRTYKCSNCGKLDRDINASLNLQLYGEEFLSSYTNELLNEFGRVL